MIFRRRNPRRQLPKLNPAHVDSIRRRRSKLHFDYYLKRYGPLFVITTFGYGFYRFMTGYVRDSFAGTYAPINELAPQDYQPGLSTSTSSVMPISNDNQDMNTTALIINNLNENNIDTNITMPYSNKSYNRSLYYRPKARGRKTYYKKKRAYNNKKPYSKKKRYQRKYNRQYVPYNVKRYIKTVSQSTVDNQSVATWRDIAPSQISCEENQCNYASYVFLDVNQLEDAIDQMKVINVNTNNAEATAMDPTAQDGLRTKILNAQSSFTIRNNGRTPCYLEARWLFVKRRMTASDTPTSIFEDGLENRGITSNETTDLRFNVYDSPEYNNFFKIYKYRKYYIQPSQEVHIVLRRTRPFIYDPDHFDKHNASDSQSKFTQWLHFRIQGVVSHDDTTTNLVGTCDATLDVVRTTHIKFSSIMGQGYRYYVVGSGALNTQTAGSKVNIPSVDEVGETL